jgi:uncharacterized protein
MNEKDTRPAPPITELSRPYWEAAAQGKLLVQACRACGTLRHYPRLLCDQCYSRDVDWTELSRRGTVHSWTVAHHAFHPSFRGELPYTLVTVDLDEGTRALGRWRGEPPTIGQAVKGEFEACDAALDLVFEARGDEI